MKTILLALCLTLLCGFALADEPENPKRNPGEQAYFDFLVAGGKLTPNSILHPWPGKEKGKFLMAMELVKMKPIEKDKADPSLTLIEVQGKQYLLRNTPEWAKVGREDTARLLVFPEYSKTDPKNGEVRVFDAFILEQSFQSKKILAEIAEARKMAAKQSPRRQRGR